MRAPARGALPVRRRAQRAPPWRLPARSQRPRRPASWARPWPAARPAACAAAPAADHPHHPHVHCWNCAGDSRQHAISQQMRHPVRLLSRSRMRFGVGLAAVECACKTRGHLLHKSGRSTALRGCQLLLQPLVLALQVAHLGTRALRTLNPERTPCSTETAKFPMPLRWLQPSPSPTSGYSAACCKLLHA